MKGIAIPAKEPAPSQRRQGCINAIVEEERLKLLKEHATKLLGYLPKVSEI